MDQIIRKAVFDTGLNLEACYFKGLAQPFPPHFHKEYVIGLVEKGNRSLRCGTETFTVKPGDLLFFPPDVIHGCTQSGEAKLQYRAFHIGSDVMEKMFGNSEMGSELSRLKGIVVNPPAANLFRKLHKAVMVQNCETELSSDSCSSAVYEKQKVFQEFLGNLLLSYFDYLIYIKVVIDI